MNPQIDWTEANGASLRCATFGNATGAAPLVMLHEVGGAIESLTATARILATGRPVIAYDQRGFGLSERANALTLTGMVDDLEALLDARGLSAVHILGAALGGTIGLMLAERAPHRVLSVIAASPPIHAIPEKFVGFLQQRARTAVAEGMRGIAEASLSMSWPEHLRSDARAFAQFRLRYLANDPESFAAVTLAMLTLDMDPLLPRIGAPALIIGCTEDRFAPPEEGRKVAEALPRGHYAEIQSGHFVGLIAPAALAAAAETFLESIDAQSR